MVGPLVVAGGEAVEFDALDIEAIGVEVDVVDSDIETIPANNLSSIVLKVDACHRYRATDATFTDFTNVALSFKAEVDVAGDFLVVEEVGDDGLKIFNVELLNVDSEVVSAFLLMIVAVDVQVSAFGEGDVEATLAGLVAT